MDVSHLKRDKKKIHNVLKETDNGLITTHSLKIYFPESYLNNELCVIDETIRLLGIFVLVLDDTYYAVSKANAYIVTEPVSINTVVINDEKYSELSYEVGSKVIVDLNLPRISIPVHKIFVEFCDKGRIPWYFDVIDVCYLFDTAYLHGNVNLNANVTLLELLASVMARVKTDKTKYFRQLENIGNFKPVWIGLKNVALQKTNTSNKLLGAYFNDGLTSALANPVEGTEVKDLESILRI